MKLVMTAAREGARSGGRLNEERDADTRGRRARTLGGGAHGHWAVACGY
jgi:hypothetical protein